MKKTLIYIFAFAIASSYLFSEININIDGDFRDWDDIKPFYENVSPESAETEGGIKFDRIKIADCNRFLYIYFEVTNVINLQNQENIRLKIDLDGDPNTGLKVNNIGADLVWNFRNKSGTFSIGDEIEISHDDIGIFPAPTISSDRFEIAVTKDKVINGKPLFENDHIHIVLKDMFDVAPNKGAIKYQFKNNKRDYPEHRFDKPVYSELRLVTYNVRNDSPFKDETEDSFRRIFNALDADIYLLQEMYVHTAEQVKELIDSLSDIEFYVDKAYRDLIVISKYPVIDKFKLNGSGAFYIDTPDDIVSEILIVNTHLKSGDFDFIRNNQTNEIMNYIDLIKRGRRIRNKTPIIIAGDMNFVGTGEQLDIMLNGNHSGKPDWNNAPFKDELIPVPNMPVYFTWYNAKSDYAPGRLDFIIYSDSILRVVNKFALFTSTMSANNLDRLGLEADDTSVTSDHLPLVIDFKIR